MIAIKALVAWGGTAIGSAIYTAQDELTSYRHRPSSLPVMVLMSDGESNRGPDPIPAAEQAKAAGTAIYAIGLGEDVNEAVMREIASDPDSEYYYFAPSSEDLDSIYERVHEHLSYLAARQTLATEILADSIHYVPGSFSIDPISISGDIAVWELGILNIGDVWTVDFNITATQPGHLPVDDYPHAEVTYLNYLGDSERVPFPQAYIDVLPPTAVREDLKPGDWGAICAEISPNPFSSFPAIRYSLAQSALVSLEIYNLAGVLIRTLVAEPKPAGTHLLSWDTKDDQAGEVPSGVYLLRLKAGDSASTQKMVLLR